MIEWMALGAGVAAGSLFTSVAAASKRRPAPASAGAGFPGADLSVVDPDHAFRIGVYNIHRARGLDGRKDLDRIASVIGPADVVGLCEVEGSFYGLGESQPRRLGRSLGLGSLFSPTQSRWLRYDRGNGLLSRYPVSRWYHEPLVDSTGRRGRILTTAQVRVGASTVHLLVTHLSRRIDQRVQLATILDRFVRLDRAILVGDFNITRDFPPMRAFLESGHGVDAIGAALGTTDDPRRIDWILTRGLTVKCGGSCAAGASDHPYYWVDVHRSVAARPISNAGVVDTSVSPGYPGEPRLAARALVAVR